jgi:hypothetical protein
MQRRCMIPLLIPGAISLASSAIDAWHNAAAAKKAAPLQQPQVNFADLLKKAGMAGAPQQALPPGQLNILASQFLQSPEMQAALHGSAGSQPVGVGIAADGTASVPVPGGGCRNLVLSPQTQALAQQLRQALGTLNQQQLTVQSGGSAIAPAGNAPQVIFQGV